MEMQPKLIVGVLKGPSERNQQVIKNTGIKLTLLALLMTVDEFLVDFTSQVSSEVGSKKRA
jgi:hypothetical protein